MFTAGTRGFVIGQVSPAWIAIAINVELMAARSGGLDARQLIAMAFRDLADNADKIGNLNISPDLLHALLETSLGDRGGGSEDVTETDSGPAGGRRR